ncbi:MAG: hypothetical protein MZV70_22440 [Desulfobacterales bacterium]|nr:hypothetical protein [Desulfobacterales bacterium]
MRKSKSIRWVRRGVQIFFFALVALISVNHTLAESGKALPWLAGASLHSICPFGGVESLWSAITGAPLVKKIHESSFVLLWIALGLSLIAGPVVCGWVCPWAASRSGWAALGRSFSRSATISSCLRSWTGSCGTCGTRSWHSSCYATTRAGTLVFESWDPYFALFNFWSPKSPSQPWRSLSWFSCWPSSWSGPSASTPAPSGRCRGVQPLPGLRNPQERAHLHQLQGLRQSLPHEHRGFHGRAGAGSPVHHLPGMHQRDRLPGGGHRGPGRLREGRARRGEMRRRQ